MCFPYRKKLIINIINGVRDSKCYKTATKPHYDPVQSSLELGIPFTEYSFIITSYHLAVFEITVLYG
jgi:hypothetical protein